MRRALVILGSDDMAKAIVDGANANESNAQSPTDSGNHSFDCSTKQAIRAATGFKDWKALYYQIYDMYGFVEDYHKPNIVSQKVLLAWALICMWVDECYKKLSARNRS